MAPEPGGGPVSGLMLMLRKMLNICVFFGGLSEASKRLLRRPTVPALNRSRPYAAARLQSQLQ